MHMSMPANQQQERIANLETELSRLQEALGKDENASQIVSKHHKLLHQYNEAKDAAQKLMGRLAERRQTTVRQIHQDYGITDSQAE